MLVEDRCVGGGPMCWWLTDVLVEDRCVDGGPMCWWRTDVCE